MTRHAGAHGDAATVPARVLVMGPAWVGDMIMAQALFKTLRRTRHDVEIDVLAPGWSAPLLARMPEVGEALQVPLTHGRLSFRTRYRLGRELAPRGYGQALILPRSFKAALIPWFARIPRRTGYLGEARFGLINDRRALDRKAMPLMVQRYVALGLPPGAHMPPDQVPSPALTVDAGNGLRLITQLGLSLDARRIGLMPGAEYGPAKQWPPEYYAALAQRLAAEGVQTLVFGSHKDFELGERIVALSGRGVNLCGKTRLQDAIDLLAQVNGAVTNDSGLMHVAAAVGVPLVAIFGSSTPAYTPPMSDRASVMYTGIECSPCFDRTCRYGHYRCLREISVAAVLKELWQLLSTTPKPCRGDTSF
ncbi:MAG: lipopolysaccharide heptosyltransferase II [Gammaproteobacteria bacterium]